MATILIVDDEDSVRQLLEAIFEEQGHLVLSASNGEQALKILEQSPPDLVISDVMMPVMDGHTLLEKIKQNIKWRAVKVLLLSAAYIKRQGPYQADEYMSKPFELAAIEAVVRRLTG